MPACVLEDRCGVNAREAVRAKDTDGVMQWCSGSELDKVVANDTTAAAESLAQLQYRVFVCVFKELQAAFSTYSEYCDFFKALARPYVKEMQDQSQQPRRALVRQTSNPDPTFAKLVPLRKLRKSTGIGRQTFVSKQGLTFGTRPECFSLRTSPVMWSRKP